MNPPDDTPQSEKISADALRLPKKERNKKRETREIIRDFTLPEEFRVREENVESFFSHKTPEDFRLASISDENTRNVVQLGLKSLLRFLDYPVIEDEFGNADDERQNFRKAVMRWNLGSFGGHQTQTEFTQAYDNKMKGNKLSAIVGTATFLAQTLEAYKNEFYDHLSPTAEQFFKNISLASQNLPDINTYSGLSDTEKKDVVRKVSNQVANIIGNVHELLEELAKLPPKKNNPTQRQRH